MSGINTIQYEVVTRQDLLIDSAPVTIVNVALTCDLLATPWCVNPDQIDAALEELKGSISADDIRKVREELAKYKSYQPFLAQ